MSTKERLAPAPTTPHHLEACTILVQVTLSCVWPIPENVFKEFGLAQRWGSHGLPRVKIPVQLRRRHRTRLRPRIGRVNGVDHAQPFAGRWNVRRRLDEATHPTELRTVLV